MPSDARVDPVRERVLAGMRTLPFDEIYEVGGSLRDELLGRVVKDVDFLVRGHSIDELLTTLRRYGPSEELRVAGRLVGVRFRPSFGPKEGIEIVPPRRESPIRPGEPDYTGNRTPISASSRIPSLPVRDDLERRDFTVNAMARDIHSGVWIDPFGGREDLAAGILRAVHPSAFRDDPLRILRGIARRGRDGLVPEPETLALMRDEAPRIAGLSAERVRETFDQAISGEFAADALRLARDVGALEAALPEWAACIGVPQRSATQAYTVDEHILHVLDEAVQRDASLVSPAGRVLARRRQAVRGWTSQPRTGGRSPGRPCDAPAGLRQRHAARRGAPRARASLRRGDRSVATRVPAASSRGSGGRPRRICSCCVAATVSGGGSRPRRKSFGGANASRRSSPRSGGARSPGPSSP